MQPSIVIVGTSHTFQAGGEDCSSEVADLLRAFLFDVCRDWNLRGIAEEMNTEGLIRYKSTQSIPSQVATALQLPHRDCDPTASERSRAGIIGSGEVLLDAQMNGLTQEETAERLTIEEIKREQYWIKKLQEQKVWPTLFVCGANHANRFKLLLDSAGHPAHTLVANWAPNTSSQDSRIG